MTMLGLTSPPLGIPYKLNATSPQARSLLGWWPTVGRRGGATIRNRAMRAYHMTLAGTYTSPYPAAVVGNAVKYNGSSGYAATTAPNPAAFTISCWVNFTSLSSNNCPVGNFGSGSDKGFWLNVTNTGVFYLWISTDGSAQSSIDSGATTLATGTWYHLAATYNAGACAIYINGRQIATGSIGSSYHATTTANAFAIGRLGALSSDYANAAIADVRLYGSALSAYEIQAMWLPQTRWDLYDLLIPQPALVPPAAPIPVPNILTAGRAWMARPTETTFQVWLFSPQGYRQQLIAEYARLSFSEGIRGGGRFTLELPPNFNTRYVKHLSYIVIEECCAGLAPRLEDVYVVQSIGGALAAGGTRFLTLEGSTATDYFLGEHSRVVAVLESEAGATYTDNADDLLKKFVKDALGAGAGNSGTAEGRDLSVYAGFTVEGERGMGPSMTQDGFNRELDKVLGEIVRRSEEAASGALRLFLYCRPVSFNPLRFQFVVLPRLFGKYRGFKASSPIILSPEWGTISTVETENDLSEGWNSVFVAYQGKTLKTRVTDSRRRNIAPAGFRETLYEATILGTEPASQDEAQAILNQGKARRMSRYKLANSRSVRWGMYGMGDVVGTLVGGAREEVEVAGFKVDHGGDGVKREVRVDAWEP